jgi:hypothetical protein
MRARLSDVLYVLMFVVTLGATFIFTSNNANAQYAIIVIDAYTGSVKVFLDPEEARLHEAATVKRMLDMRLERCTTTVLCRSDEGEMQTAMSYTVDLRVAHEDHATRTEERPLGVTRDKKGRIISFQYPTESEDGAAIMAKASVLYNDVDKTMIVTSDLDNDPNDYRCEVHYDEKGRVIQVREESDIDAAEFVEYEFEYDEAGNVATMTILSEPTDVSNRTTRVERTFDTRGLIVSENVYGDCKIYVCGSSTYPTGDVEDDEPYTQDLILQEIRELRFK